ncbi:MAG: Nif3-like dinuclear metal center hexameric protein [Clostridia bacterium]|nr:Nif3-like dinuclear metal center hexameric protein [Clostridia bacterium]
MVTMKDFCDYLETLAPSALAEDYDNVGILIGDQEAEITRILISLDTDESVVCEAERIGADLVLSHHPLLFHPLKQIVRQDAVGNTVIKLIQSGINLYAMHTNFDSVKNGLCDYFLKTICNAEASQSMEGEFPDGIGRITELPEKIMLSDLLAMLKERLHMEHIRFVGDENQTISKLAVCNGGGADLIYDAYHLGADVYISGDFKYHHARHAYETGKALVEVPHYEAEILFCDYMAEILQKHFGQKCEVFVYKNENPWKNI